MTLVSCLSFTFRHAHPCSLLICSESAATITLGFSVLVTGYICQYCTTLAWFSPGWEVLILVFVIWRQNWVLISALPLKNKTLPIDWLGEKIIEESPVSYRFHFLIQLPFNQLFCTQGTKGNAAILDYQKGEKRNTFIYWVSPKNVYTCFE